MVNNVPVADKNYDQILFEKFIQQVPVGSCANRSQEDFNSLTNEEKKVIIRQYYNNMKSRRIFGG